VVSAVLTLIRRKRGGSISAGEIESCLWKDGSVMTVDIEMLGRLTETQIAQSQLSEDDLRALSVQPDEVAEPGEGVPVEPAKCDKNYIRCDEGYSSQP